MPPHLNILAFSIPDIGATLWTILGIGLVIFVHELGHFLCAKKAGVRVEVFSLGFGPRLFGFVRGGTDYRLSAVPVGGYVKMAGDQPGESEGRDDELLSKSVSQRALVYSGGVMMNVVFALVVFPLVFAAGVPMVKPAVGSVVPGGPAWHAGLLEGDEILSVNGRPVLGFTDVALEVALSDPAETELLVRRDGEERVVAVTPEYNGSNNTIGIGEPTDYVVKVRPDGPAARAGLRDGDRIVALDGRPFDDGRFRELGLEPRDQLVLTVVRDPAVPAQDIVLRPEWTRDEERPVLGIRACENVVVGLRRAFTGGPLRAGDRLTAVAGTTVWDVDDVESALLEADVTEGVSVTIQRDGKEIQVRLPPELAAALADDVALSYETDEVEVPGPVPVRVSPGTPAEQVGLRTGMGVVTVEGRAVHDWADLRREIADAEEGPVRLRVQTATDEARTFDVTPAPSVVGDFGFDLELSQVERRYGMKEAFLMGLHSSWNFTRQAYLMLKKMVARQVSADNLGGIVAIGHVSYRFAERGLAKLFYFLALLSINLAVINLLPIPVLDGGHLMFLLIEKVKGTPVNDRVLGYSQVLGVVLILSLLIFVTYNDIKRIIG